MPDQAAGGGNQFRGQPLNDAIADCPERKKPANLPETPAIGLEKDRQADHKPDIPRPEEKDPRQREHVHPVHWPEVG